MTELAKEAFTSRNYHLAVELYERCLKQQGSSYEVLLGYGDSLTKCGRVRESIAVYTRCLAAAPVPAERLKHLATALLEDMAGVGPISRRRIDASFACPLCEGTLCQPVTAGCGHTYCRNCAEPAKNCRVCGTKITAVSETNVLVQRLVERWWPREAEASRARHEGDVLVRKGHLEQALERYNLAVHLGECTSRYRSSKQPVHRARARARITAVSNSRRFDLPVTGSNFIGLLTRPAIRVLVVARR